MKLGPHLAISTAVGGAVWAVTGEPLAVPAAIAAGVLPDADHVLDFYIKYVRRDRRFLFLLFHGWEFLAAGIVLHLTLFSQPWALAAVLGYAGQLIADQAANRVKWHTYFITARAALGFRSVRVLGRDDSRSYLALVESLPFGRSWLRSWFQARLPHGQERSAHLDARDSSADREVDAVFR